jgi:hypothetical protein
MITAGTLRNIVAVMQSIDRHELEKEAGPLSDVAWSKFRDDAHQSFLHMPDAEQEAIARIVSARMDEIGER